MIWISSQFCGPLGPLDAGTNNALPRRAIPEEFIKDLRKKVTHVTFASNPCRVRFFTQEIVLFREDLLRKMQRHVVVPPSLDSEGHDICQQLVESILDQGHLCPLPLHVRPVYWDLDYTLRLSPLPHLVQQTHTQIHVHINWLPYSLLALLPLSNVISLSLLSLSVLSCVPTLPCLLITHTNMSATAAIARAGRPCGVLFFRPTGLHYHQSR